MKTVLVSFFDRDPKNFLHINEVKYNQFILMLHDDHGEWICIPLCNVSKWKVRDGSSAS